MEGGYYFLLLNPQAGSDKAPSYKIYTVSPSTEQTSIFVWTPGLNDATQGPTLQDVWNHHNFTEDTGSSDPWPVPQGGTTGGDGWWCSQKCLLGSNPNNYVVGASVRRDLRTFVEGLLAQPVDSGAYI